MNDSKQYFYVVYPADHFCQVILDTIRFVADPSTKFKAHITLRGPYQKLQDFGESKSIVEDVEVHITGVDGFLNEQQSTVFFAINAPTLIRAWKKRDHKKYNPHLTIYDGDSREFAVELFNRLRVLGPKFAFRTTALMPLLSWKKQRSLDSRSAYDETLVFDITGMRVSAENVDKLSEAQRLTIVEELCVYLSMYTREPSQVPS